MQGNSASSSSSSTSPPLDSSPAGWILSSPHHLFFSPYLLARSPRFSSHPAGWILSSPHHFSLSSISSKQTLSSSQGPRRTSSVCLSTVRVFKKINPLPYVNVPKLSYYRPRKRGAPNSLALCCGRVRVKTDSWGDGAKSWGPRRRAEFDSLVAQLLFRLECDALGRETSRE